MGVAAAGRGRPAVTVLRWADLALCWRRTSSGFEVYRPELDLQDASRLGLLADLRNAISATPYPCTTSRRSTWARAE